MNKHHVIYVPGISDHRSYGQDLLIQLWRFFGLTPHYFPLYWEDKEPFNLKLSRLINKINDLKKDGNIVSLVGVSAGASATLNAYSSVDNLTGVVWICGKINNPQTVSSRIYEKNPAFKESMMTVAKNLEKLDEIKLRHIMSIHPIKDNVVPPDDTKVIGTVEKTIKSKGHAVSIFYGIIFCGRTISHFLRSFNTN